MVFVTAGMGGGTGTGAAPVIARVAREMGILTVGVVTKPFHFEGGLTLRGWPSRACRVRQSVDTLIIIPNQNLFRVANEKTTFADAFAMADQVLYSGVACITDLMVKEGLINLDFADVRSIMSEMGKAMMGTGEATGDRRAVQAAEAAIANPLLDEVSMKGARGLLISITGGNDLTLYEVDEAASRIRQEVDEEANIILGATFDSSLDGVVRVSVVATGIDQAQIERAELVASAPQIEASTYTRAPASRSMPTPITVVAASEPQAPVAASAFVQEAAASEVEVRPVAPKPTLYFETAPERDEEPPAEEFIPPAPEQPFGRQQPRMPQIEDLPMGGPQSNSSASRRNRVPAGGRGDAASLAARKARRFRDQPPPRRLRAGASRYRAARVGQGRQRRAPRGIRPPLAASGDDAVRAGPIGCPHGRVASRPAPVEDDQLEIPAFLRRQAVPLNSATANRGSRRGTVSPAEFKSRPAPPISLNV